MKVGNPSHRDIRDFRDVRDIPIKVSRLILVAGEKAKQGEKRKNLENKTLTSDPPKHRKLEKTGKQNEVTARTSNLTDKLRQSILIKSIVLGQQNSTRTN